MSLGWIFAGANKLWGKIGGGGVLGLRGTGARRFAEA